MAALQIIVVTPERTTLDQTTESVTVPLLDGEAGILSGHAPMIGRLAPGEMRISTGGKVERFYVDGGFVQVADNVVSVLTGRSIPIDQINVAAARQILEKTEILTSEKSEVIELKNKTIAQARAQIRIAGNR